MGLKERFVLGLLPFVLSSCMGATFLNRGRDDGKPALHTPSLHSVPDRPEHLNNKNRQKLARKMKESFEKQEQLIPKSSS